MTPLRILGFDPSLRNWGYVTGTYQIDSGEFFPESIGLIQTILNKNKQVRQNSKDIEHAGYLANKIFSLVDTIKPHVIFVEVPVGSKSARAMASYGICIGLLGALKHKNYFMFEVLPLEIKMITKQNKTASKLDIINWAYKLYPKLDWPTRTVKNKTNIITSKAEHIADAIGAVHAGLASSQFVSHLKTIKLLTQEN